VADAASAIRKAARGAGTPALAGHHTAVMALFAAEIDQLLNRPSPDDCRRLGLTNHRSDVGPWSTAFLCELSIAPWRTRG
jgi:hypothetical protein